MKTTTTAFDTAAAKAATKPVWLCDVINNAGTTIARWTDKAIADTFASAYDAYVLNWGTIDSQTTRMSGGGAIENMEMAVTHVADSTVEDAVKVGNRVKIYLGFEGESLSSSDLLLMFSGVIIDPIIITETKISFSCSSISEVKSKDVSRTVHAAICPRVPDKNIGRVMPIIYGSVDRVEAIQSDSIPMARLVSTTSGNLTNCNTGSCDISSAGYIYLDDSSVFPSSGIVYIGNERIQYSANNTTTNILTVLKVGSSPNVVIYRGIGGTPISDHLAGEVCWMQDSSNGYLDYIVAAHDVKDVSAVYISDVQLDTDDYSHGYDSSGDFYYVRLGNTRQGMEVLKDIEKRTQKNENLSRRLEDDAATNISDFPKDPTTSGSGSGTGSGWAIGTLNGASGHLCYALAYFGASAASSPLSTIAFGYWLSYTAVSWTTSGQKIIVYLEDSNGTQVEVRSAEYDGSVVQVVDSGTFFDASAYSTAWRLGVWHNLGSGQNANISMKVAYIERRIESVPKINDISQLIENAVVYADVDGMEDDASGTYTGTANALIANPAHCVHHLLVTYGKGVVSTDLDSSISATTNEYGSNFNVGFRLNNRADLTSLCKNIAFQSFSRFFWDAGKAYFKPIRKNLLFNGDFQRFDGDVAWRWQNTSISVTKVASGDGYYLIVTTTSDTNGLTQSINVQSGVTLTVKARCKVSSGSTMKLKVTSGASYDTETITSSDWAEYTVSITTASTSAQIDFYADVAGQVGFIDYAKANYASNASIIKADVVINSMSKGFTGQDQIINAGTMYYNGNDENGYVARYEPLEDIDTDWSWEQYGHRHDAGQLSLPAVQSSAVAARVIDSYIDKLSYSKGILTFSTHLGKVALQRGDVISVTHDGFNLSSKLFEIVGVTVTIGSIEEPDIVTIKAEEI